MITKIASFITILATLFVMGSFSLFLYANAYEQLTFQDLPYIRSTETTTIPNILKFDNDNLNSPEEKYGFFGMPVTLRIPRLNYSVNLVEASKRDTGWISGNTTQSIHYITKSKAGRIGDVVLFRQKYSKIMQFEHLLTEGDRIVIETKDKWKYNFKVTKRSTIGMDDSYVPSDTSYSRLIFITQKDNAYILVEAEIVSLEEL